jgi:hypothetical protein
VNKGLFHVVVFHCLLFCGVHASAFDNYEHKAIGDISLQIASYLLKSEENCRIQPGRSICNELAKWQPVIAAAQSEDQTTSASNILSYGDIVQCVDNFLTPEKLMTWLRDPDETDNEDSTNIAFPDILNQKPAHGNNKCHIEKRNAIQALAANAVQAAHSNHAHFQNELLLSLSTYHTLAMSVARSKEDLGAALLINAIADHYLQDYFAPGHIVTRRSHLTDSVATAMHDYRNDLGANFYVNGGGESKSNLAVLNTLHSIGCLLSSSKPTDLCSRDHVLPLTDPEANELICRLMVSPQLSDCVGVLQSAEEKPLSRDEVINAIRVLTVSNSSRKAWVCMKGDGRLWRKERDHVDWRSDNDCGDAVHQRLFMVAANVTSILEVMRAHTDNVTKSSMTQYDWKFRWPNRADDCVYAALPFGSWTIGKAAKPAGSCAPNTNTQVASEPPDEKQIPELPHGPTQQNFYYENIFGLSMTREAFYKGNRVGDWAYSLETQPGWVTPRTVFGNKVDIGVGLGLVKLIEGDVQAGGATGRLVVTIPETESSFGIWLRRLYHGGNAEHGWRYGYGLIFEQGYSSIISLHIGVGRDFGAEPGGRLQQGTLLFGGLSITFPEGRLPGLHKQY